MFNVLSLSQLALTSAFLTSGMVIAQEESAPAPAPVAPVAPVEEEGAEAKPAPVGISPTEGRPFVNPIPENRLYLGDLSVIRINPIGLETQNRLMYQHRLKDTPEVLFADTFWAAGGSLKLNPAYLKVGPLIDYQPIALLNFRLGYEFVQYFGSFGYLQSKDDPHETYSDPDLDAGDELGQAYVTNGHHLFFEPTFQVKVKKVVVKSKFSLEKWNLALNEGDTVFYDATLDTLVPNGGNGWIWANDTDLLFLAKPKLVAGIRYSVIAPRYAEGLTVDDDDIAAARPAYHEDGPLPTLDELEDLNGHKRVGPMVAYSFHTRNYTRFNRPTLLAVTGWYVDHRYRQGGSPYILVGFGFTSDLMDKK